MLQLHFGPWDREASADVAVYKATNPDQPVWWDLASEALPDYTVSLPPGDYKILSGNEHWYGGKSFASAKIVTLRGGTTKLTLHVYYSVLIDADVENHNGVTVPFARVAVYDETDPTEVVARLTADETGAVLGLIGPGQKARVIDPTGRYYTQWAQEKSSFKTASDAYTWRWFIYLTPKAPLKPHSGVPTQANATIQGTLDGPGLDNNLDEIYLYPADDDTNWVRFVGIGAEGFPSTHGDFTIADVPAGKYKLRFGDSTWYGGSSHKTATVVTATDGLTTNVDFTVPAHGDLVGQVRSARGTEVDDLLVRAYDPETGSPLAYAKTGRLPDRPENGWFRFEDLPAKPVQILVTDAEDRFTNAGGTAAPRPARPPRRSHRSLARTRTSTSRSTTASSP